MKSYSTLQASAYCFRNNGCANTLWRNAAWFSSLPPYPGVPHLRGDPSTGQLPYLREKDGILQTLQKAAILSEKSVGMCSFWVERRLMLFITKPEYIFEFKQYYAQHMAVSVDSLDMYPGRAAVHVDTGRGMQLRSSSVLFGNRSLHNLQKKIEKIIDDYLNCIKEEETFDAGKFFRKLALQLTIQLFMGINDTSKVDLDGLCAYVSTLLRGPNADTPLYLLGLKDITAESEIEEVRRFNKEAQATLKKLIVDPHQNEILKSDNLFHSLWKLGKELRLDQEFTTENLFPEAFVFLTGGLITTIGDFFPVIFELIDTHPEVKEKLLQELRNNQEQNQHIAIEKLPYLDRVIKEAFRLRLPLPVIPVKKVTKDFTFHDVHLKKGDSIVISPQINHHFASIWKDPDKFDPERFSDENQPEIPPGAYLPFGLGSRSCIARHYSTFVLKMTIAKILNKFEMQVKNDQVQFHLLGPTLETIAMGIRLTPRAKDEKKVEEGVSPPRKFGYS